MSTASELIRRIDFFQPLDDRIIDKIAHLCIAREYSPGDHIVRQGDPGLGLYFITRGSARVEIARDGVVTPVAELHAGEFVGELSIIDQKPRSANVVCATDASCLLLTRDRFMKLLDKHPEIALQMAKALAGRLRSADERMWHDAVAVPVPSTENWPAVERRVAAQPAPRSDAQKIKDALTDAVSWVYLLKSVMEVSLAVVGCPVAVSLETRASESRVWAINQLKLVLFPATENHLLGVHAFADGAFTATIFRPVSTPAFTGVCVSRFRALVRRNESVWLQLPAFESARLESAGERVQGARTHFAVPGSARHGMRDLEDALDF